MKKLLLPVLLLAILVLGACRGAPDETPAPTPEPEIVTIVETQIVEVEVEKIVEVEVEKIVEVEVVVTPTLAPPEPITEYGVLYFRLKQNTVLWELVSYNAETKEAIFQKHTPLVAYNEGDIVVVYNGRGAAEYFLNEDGSLFVSEFPSFPNAQGFYCDEKTESEHLYAHLIAPGKLDLCEDEWADDDGNLYADEPEAAMPGVWKGAWLDADGNQGEGDRWFYKVAGPAGPGLFVRADHGFLPSCETAKNEETGEIYFKNFSVLSIPESCAQ